MKRSVIVALAAAGLVLAGCGSHTSPSSGGGSGSTGSGTLAGSGSAPTSAQGVGTPLFPIALGDTWTYTITLGTEHGTEIEKVTAVTPVAGGHRVRLQTTPHVAGLPATTTDLVYIFHSDGSITVPFQQVGSSDVTVKSGAIVWPSQAQLNSGQPEKSTLDVVIHSSSLSQTVHARIVVKGEGTQSVTVPAGTYSATVVNETVSEKFEGVSVSTVVRTWLAPGVGPVKSEVLSVTLGTTKAGAVDELKSFKG
jgi:hypothetical protein